MTAAQVQLREELFWRLRRRLGLDCTRQQIAVFSDRGDAVLSFGCGQTLTTMRVPWSDLSKRHIWQDIFEIDVLNGLLREAIYSQ